MRLQVILNTHILSLPIQYPQVICVVCAFSVFFPAPAIRSYASVEARSLCTKSCKGVTKTYCLSKISIDSPDLANESARPMILADDTEAIVMPMRRGPCFWRLPWCVPASEKKHHSTRSPCEQETREGIGSAHNRKTDCLQARSAK